MSVLPSVLVPLEPGSSSCGYCGPPGQRSATNSSWHYAECTTTRLTCDHYQRMIDRGWRRSGTYCYKPDLKRSCCPQYTIKLEALQFKYSKSQRKLVNRFNRFILHGDKGDSDNAVTDGEKRGASKSSNAVAVSELSIHDAEQSFLSEGQKAVHNFTVTLERSSFTEEKYELYKKYQTTVHKDERNSPRGFTSFLVNSPLRYESIPYTSTCPDHLPKDFGSYHQTYRVDGTLIAIGVIDILPTCVSSVYFIYDPDWERFSFGKLSALREIALAREINKAGYSRMDSLYMGFYIQSCPKMRYKGEYAPSFLADPEDYTWHPLEVCRPLLEKHHYAAFSHPEHSLDKPDDTKPTPPTFSDEDLREIHAIEDVRNRQVFVTPLNESKEWQDPDVQRTLTTFIDAIGLPVAKEVLLDLANSL